MYSIYISEVPQKDTIFDRGRGDGYCIEKLPDTKLSLSDGKLVGLTDIYMYIFLE